MTEPAEFELTEAEQLDAYYKLRELSKLDKEISAELDAVKDKLKAVALTAGAQFLTIDGHRELQVTRTRPNKFDSAKFKNDQPRMYEAYVRPSDADVVTLRFVGGRP